MTPMDNINHAQGRSAVVRFFSHPMVGFVGALASILGFLFAFYFYYQGREIPELTYFINPAKATIVKTGQAQGLAVFHSGIPIDSDVTAVQIALWNAGKKAIKSEHILKSVVISTLPPRRILEASLRKPTRDVVAFGLDLSSTDQGRVGLEWRILEQDDGAVIQVIFAGSSDTELLISGTLEGQKDILAYHPSTKTLVEVHPFGFLGQRYAVWAGLAVAILMLLLIPAMRVAFPLPANLTGQRSIARLLAMVLRWLPWLFLLGSLSYLLLSLNLLLLWSPPGPPFGFEN